MQALIQVAGVGAGDKETRGVGDEGIHNSSFLNPNSRRDVPAEGLYPNTDVPAEGLYPNTDVPAEGLYPNTDVPAEGLYPNTDVPAERLYPNTEVPPEGLYPNTEVPPEGLYPNTEVPAERLYPTRNSSNPKSLKPEDIGFRLGPRINAIGRIGDPQIVIDLLTTDDMGIALARAMQCEAINKQRQQMCSEIELEAIAIVEAEFISSLQQNRVLVVVKSNWHHGVIGIVASRLVERYGVPVFIATYEDETHIRGSARGIPEFNVFAALEYCHDLLGKYGGHKAAGGFSFPAENLPALRSLLCEFANKSLALEHIKPLIKIDAKANLNEIKSQLYQQLNVLHPCGIDNPDPVFWTPDVQVIEQKIVGKGHIKLTVAQIIDNRQFKIKAIAWRWGDYFPLPSKVDIAYKLRENNFNGSTTIELELTGVRLAKQSHLSFTSTSTPSKSTFEYNQRHYSCGIYQNGELPELRIKNSEGKVLAVQPGQSNALLGTNRQDAKIVDISQPQYDGIIQAALKALKSVKS
ncbi:MAG: hypothetical protein KME54_01775 [Tolypothrix brevis GSE-NOS-MK-07-07A]|nr:hypothetical protein [Tolypothrix brevis GSE-NOS-MK-07-07A]